MTTVAQDPDREALLAELQSAVDALRAADAAVHATETEYAQARDERLRREDEVRRAMNALGVQRIVLGDTLTELITGSPSPTPRLTKVEVVP